MIIGLQDVDGHHFPNLPLMKLSAWHKGRGDLVEWYREDREMYDIVYKSKVFSDVYSPDTPEPNNAKLIKKGGTGYHIHLIDGKEVFDEEHHENLPDEVEHIYPDYSLYPEYTGGGGKLSQQTAYGFLTRGCPRGCGFCHVAAKEGRCSRKVADLSEFWHGQGRVVLNDPNILACKEAPDLLRQLVESGAKIELNQGVDARLLNEEKADYMAQFPWLVEPHFAMDSMQALKPVQRGLNLYREAWERHHDPTKRGGTWNWRRARVYMLTNYDTTFEQDMQRIKTIQDCGCWPYVMIYNKPAAPKITRRLQRWTNNPFLYGATKDFWEMQKKNYKTTVMPDGTEISNEEEMQLSLFD